MNIYGKNYNNFGDFHRKPPIYQLNKYKHSPYIHNNNQQENYARKMTPDVNSQNSALSRCNSSGKAMIQNYRDNQQEYQRRTENSYLNNNSKANSSNVSIHGYLDRRHFEAQERINKMRYEKYTKEFTELPFRPKISENSKRIVSNLINKEQSQKPLSRNSPQLTVHPPNRANNEVQDKLTKTIDELNQYKRIIDKREEIIKYDEVNKTFKYSRFLEKKKKRR
jgi:hypothetical protein